MSTVIIEKNETINETFGLERLLIEFQGLIEAIILIGSYADETSIEYSDIDTILIHNSDNLNEVAKISNRARVLLRRFDCLQHHGFVLEKKLGTKWSDAEIPLDTIRKSKIIVSNSERLKIEFEDAVNPGEYTSNLRIVLESVRNRLKYNKIPKNYYSYKSILSQIMLVPALYSSAKLRKGVDKGDSFKVFQDLLPRNVSSLWLEMCTHERKSWNPNLNKLSVIIHRYSPPYLHKVFVKIPNPSMTDNIFMKQQFINSITEFIDWASEDCQ